MQEIDHSIQNGITDFTSGCHNEPQMAFTIVMQMLQHFYMQQIKFELFCFVLLDLAHNN